MGLVVTMLSVSGVVIWRKRCVQAEASRLQRGARAMSPPYASICIEGRACTFCSHACTCGCEDTGAPM